ncbi:MAG: carbonic anhydrase, partial [Sphaerospermopsis kisseleviana]
KNQTVPGNVGSIVDEIRPALPQIQQRTSDISDINDSNYEQNAIINNIQYQVERLQNNSAVLAKLIGAGRLNVVGAFYDLDTGKVNFI